jgi:hypothetical protein
VDNAKPQACREWTGWGSSVGYKQSECGVGGEGEEGTMWSEADLRKESVDRARLAFLTPGNDAKAGRSAALASSHPPAASERQTKQLPANVAACTCLTPARLVMWNGGPWCAQQLRWRRRSPSVAPAGVAAVARLSDDHERSAPLPAATRPQRQGTP